MASNISKRIQSAKESPIDVYGDVLNNPRQRLTQEFTIAANVGEHEANKSQTAQKKASAKKTDLKREAITVGKKKGKSMSYEAEYAKRRGGHVSRYKK